MTLSFLSSKKVNSYSIVQFYKENVCRNWDDIGIFIYLKSDAPSRIYFSNHKLRAKVRS